MPRHGDPSDAPLDDARAPTPPTDVPRRLWGLGTGRTLRPIWLMLELDLPYVQEEILTRTASMDRPDFQALSARKKIPMFEDGDVVLGESAAICLYLADRHRDRGVFAPDPGTTARTLHDELCWFAMTEMDAILYTIRRHEGLPDVYGASEVACDAARSYFLRSVSEIERRLADDRPYLLGEAFSVADLLVKSCLDWATLVCGVTLSDSLADYSAHLAERPAFGEAMRRNFPPAALAALTGGNTP